MDNAVPLDVVLHIDYIPWNEEIGWDIDELLVEIRRAFNDRLVKTGYPRDVELVDVEVLW